MSRYFLSLACLVFSTLIFAQNNAVKKHAGSMGNALLTRDYKAFVKFSYPKILKDMGGAEKMAASIERQMKGMEAQGTQIISLTYGEPDQIIKEGKELQCIVPQQMTLNTPQGKILAKTSLIAMSPDNGERWYFVDAGERDLETIRKSLPNLSKSLRLPKPSPPQTLKN